MTKLSSFATRFTQNSGIAELMHDLGEAMNSQDDKTCMLGGGKPAHIPEVMSVFRELSQTLIDSGQWDHHLASYSPPQGDTLCIDQLCDFFNQHYGWGIRPENIALTNGSQTSFFYLFNIFAGQMAHGDNKKILFPLSPEYIGYRDLGLSDDFFCSQKPLIETLERGQFKYHIDFDALELSDDIGAICVSRPTNPTGNVISDEELEQLDQLAQAHNIPLMIDNAYGLPFPGAIYSDATLNWHDNMILGFSLSKLGLPGVRTGIVIAKKETIDIVRCMNGTLCLSPSNIGPSLLTELIRTEQIHRLCEETIRPYYQTKLDLALSLVATLFHDISVRIHKPEGAFFLWLWFPELPISSQVLYQRLKAKQVYVIPGENFFMDIEPQWQHQYQCLRINTAFSDEQLHRGLQMIADEVRSLMS